MTRKKNPFLLGLVLLIAVSASGQDKVWADSSYYQASKLPQYNEFVNNLYAFPPKPRNMWEVGVKVGSPTIEGDVSSIFPSFGWGVHARKSLGYVLSLRMEFVNGTALGQNWQVSGNYMNNPAWARNGYRGNTRTTSGVDQVYYNYKNRFSDLSVQGIINLNNIRFHKAQNKFNIYAIVGAGLTWYDVKVNALNGTQKYDFNRIASGGFTNRKDVKDQLKQMMDDTYETEGEDAGRTWPNPRFSATFGGGVAVRLSRRLNIALEDRITVMRDDLLDGQRWAAQPLGDPSMTRSYDVLNYLSLGLNINIF